MAKKSKPQNRGLFTAFALAGTAVFGFVMFQQWTKHDSLPSGDGTVAADEHMLDRIDDTNAVGRALKEVVQPATRSSSTTSSGSAVTRQVAPAAPVDPTDKQTRENAKRGAIVGLPAVVSANSFQLQGRTVVLWGVAVPQSQVPCVTGQVSWSCGTESLTALRQFLGLHEVACFDKGNDNAGRMVGQCFVGPLDVAGDMVRNGWAVADSNYTRAYTPQESDAKFKRRGIWTGNFDRSTFVGAFGAPL